MLGERLGVGVRPEGVEQPRRAPMSAKRKVTVPVGKSFRMTLPGG